jgi:hypothetical protein
MTTAQPGTVSHGTCNPEHLIPRFTDFLEVLDRDHALIAEARAVDMGNDDEVATVLDALFDAIGEFAPEGYYFGSHPGDGSDYGFWQSEEF